MNTQLIVFAKAPRPGLVKTRLCPPCTGEQAAAVAAAALADTIDTVNTVAVSRRALVLSGDYHAPHGWHVYGQRGRGLGERLANAFADATVPATASVLIGMDTPQVTAGLLAGVVRGLAAADAVLGPAIDGGWWVLALREPNHAQVLTGVEMSTSRTMALTAEALRRRGLTVATAAWLRDVDTAADAWAVVRQRPTGRFAEAVRANIAPDGSPGSRVELPACRTGAGS